MSFLAYKLVHLAGLFTLTTVLAGVCVQALHGDASPGSRRTPLVAAVFVLAALLILIGGFGMLARMGLLRSGLPRWALVKLGIWIGVVAMATVPHRGPGWARFALLALPIVLVLAGATALYKPF